MTPVKRDRTMQGIAAMAISQLAFLLNDTLIKVSSERLPLGEIIFLRGLLATIFVAVAVVALGQHRAIATLRHRMLAWRSVGELGGTVFYLIALFQMPIATVVILFQAVPLTVTAAAAIFLREPVGWHRWAAIVVGFLGVVIVVRPGLDSFNIAALLVLLSVAFVSLRDIATQRLPHTVPTLLATLAMAALITLVGAAIGLSETWLMPTAWDWLRLVGAAIFLSVGYATAIVAVRLGDMSVTAPFRYVSVVFAILIGYLVWSDVPDALTIGGSALIVGAGLYTLYRERQALKRGGTLVATEAALEPPVSGRS